MPNTRLNGKGEAMLKNVQRSTFNTQVRVQNLECGDKSRAVRESRHRFPSALCAEGYLGPEVGDLVPLSLRAVRGDTLYSCSKSGVARNTACRRTPSVLARLSVTPLHRKNLCVSAPATIIDDVKAEIKRQEERQKGVHEAVY
jgi:hypothetical protein